MSNLDETTRLRLMAPPTDRVRAVIDTDTYNEIDDQFAIIQALLAPDRIDLEAIYAAPFHNARSSGPAEGMALSYDEILRLLERMDRAPEGFVFRGVEAYVGPDREPRAAPAVDDLIERARSATSEAPLYVIAIAAISNVASAILRAPDIVDRIVVLWLGGHALEWPHVREFNLRQDVAGAAALLDSGVALVLFPCLGVVSHLRSTVPEIEAHVAPHGRIGAFLAQRFKDHTSDPVAWSKEIWDMAPVGWLVDPETCATAIVPRPILTSEPTWSMDRTRPAMRYVYWIERDRVFADFFSKLAAFAAGEVHGSC